MGTFIRNPAHRKEQKPEKIQIIVLRKAGGTSVYSNLFYLLFISQGIEKT